MTRAELHRKALTLDAEANKEYTSIARDIIELAESYARSFAKSELEKLRDSRNHKYWHKSPFYADFNKAIAELKEGK